MCSCQILSTNLLQIYRYARCCPSPYSLFLLWNKSHFTSRQKRSLFSLNQQNMPYYLEFHSRVSFTYIKYNFYAKLLLFCEERGMLDNCEQQSSEYTQSSFVQQHNSLIQFFNMADMNMFNDKPEDICTYIYMQIQIYTHAYIDIDINILLCSNKK